MDKKFVRVLCDVHCDWEGLPPVYRVYVNDELFAERTWTWNNVYLEELLQIEAEPGKYHIRHELVPPHLATLKIENMRVELGDAHVVKNHILRIHDENS
jgi:hypothetical protein